VPQVQYNFVPLNELDAVEPGQTCDVLGVITHNGELSEIVSKATGKPVPKRELTVADSSGMSVRVTLWGKTAENFRTDEEQPIIAFKGVKVGDFGGRSLSMHSGSTMSLNLEIDEAFALKGWYEAEGNKSNFKSYSNAGMGGGGGGQGGGPANSTLEDRKTVVEVKEEKLGSNDEKADWFTMKAVVVYVKPDTLFYTACPGEGCSKKVNMENGEWRCEKCDRSYPDCDHR
jgi:replication factor A1